MTQLIPSWRKLSFHGRSPLFKTSIAIMIIVPIWARLSGAIEYGQHDPLVLNQLLDATLPPLPDNLLRLFWTSFITNISNITYSFFCPLILRRYSNFKQWYEQDEGAIINWLSMRHKLGTSKDDEILDNLRCSYNNEIDSKAFSYPAVRLFITMLYVVSLLLTARVILEQIILVFKVTNFKHIFI
jgi:hypothetical protein